MQNFIFFVPGLASVKNTQQQTKHRKLFCVAFNQGRNRIFALIFCSKMSDSKQVQEDNVEDSNYSVGKKVTVGDIMNMDKEDESLRKYKEALLGQASKEIYSRKNFAKK
jgi:hypothetical protein